MADETAKVNSLPQRLGNECEKNIPSRDYELRIKQARNGFIVNVGCETFVFSNLNELLGAISLYFTNFEAAKKRYYK